MHLEERVAGGHLVNPLLEKDVLLRLVREDERNLRLVALGAQLADGVNDLRHRRDAGTARNHANLLVLPTLDLALHLNVEVALALVLEAPLRPLHLDGALTDLEVVEVVAHLAAGVDLDDKVDVAKLVVAGRRRVRAHDLRLIRVVGLEHERDVLPNGQAQNVLVALQAEAEPPRVVAHNLLLHQREVAVLLRGQRDGALG
mmetsp:Transcript_44316/g.139195  ORF Transcript_44316/g.139195 Transcript_44316/m.139195 type:complete len:201 (+) Transcript_44316:360-962(+)